jgi:hypothetical protein
MAWHSTDRQSPEKSGSYLVTVLLQRQFGQSSFNYVAYFDNDKKAWYKQDNFAGKEGLGEEITKEVTRWLDHRF